MLRAPIKRSPLLMVVNNHVSTIVHEIMHAIGNEFSLVFLKGLCQAWDEYTFLGNCPLTSHLGQNVAFGKG